MADGCFAPWQDRARAQNEMRWYTAIYGPAQKARRWNCERCPDVQRCMNSVRKHGPLINPACEGMVDGWQEKPYDQCELSGTAARLYEFIAAHPGCRSVDALAMGIGRNTWHEAIKKLMQIDLVRRTERRSGRYGNVIQYTYEVIDDERPTGDRTGQYLSDGEGSERQYR